MLEPNENDPESLKKARLEEEKIILKWVEDYKQTKTSNSGKSNYMLRDGRFTQFLLYQFFFYLGLILYTKF